MARKKFSISDALAKGIKNAVHTGSENRGQLQYELMDIAMIELDPNNPRKLLLTKQDVANRDGVTDARKIAELDSLASLADSITRVGVRNAIEVYKDGAKYRLISGERRLLASILADKKDIPARISDKPGEFKLRYLQWIENINREDLSLWEKYLNLQQLTVAYRFQNPDQDKVDGKVIIEMLGVSSTQAYRYLCLLKADQETLALIQKGQITSLKQLDEIRQKTKPVDNIRAQASKHFRPREETRGRKAQQINLGKTANLAAAKTLYEIILASETFTHSKQHFNNIDWSSPKSITQAFERIVTILESTATI